VRFATAGRSLTRTRLTDFDADSLSLRGGDAPPRLARAELTRLQVSLGPDRARGRRIGGVVGAVGGGLLLGGVLASRGGWGLVVAPAGAGVGALFGGALGVGAGHVFAPPAWSSVPLPRAP
jgi:hypothetical protein